MRKFIRKSTAFVLAFALVLSCLACIPALAEDNKILATEVDNIVYNAATPATPSVPLSGGNLATDSTADHWSGYFNTTDKGGNFVSKTLTADEGYGLTSYRIEYDTKINSVASGFTFGSSGTWKVVLFQLSISGKDYLTYRPHICNGSLSSSSLAFEQETSISSEEAKDWFHVSITVTEQSTNVATAVVSVEGEELDTITVSDGQLTLHRIGFRHGSSEAASFDNVEIYNTDNEKLLAWDFNYSAIKSGKCGGPNNTESSFEGAGAVAELNTPTMWMAPGQSTASLVIFHVQGQYNKFSGTVAFCDEALTPSYATDGDYIEIYADNALLWTSDNLKTNPAQPFDVTFSADTEFLTIKVYDSSGNDQADHVNFFDTYFDYNENVNEAVLEVQTLISNLQAVHYWRAATEIAAARAAYETLSEEDQELVSNYSALLAYEADYAAYAALTRDSDIGVTVTGWPTADADPTPRQSWVLLATEEEQKATQDALADEFKYLYIVKNHKIGNLNTEYVLSDYWFHHYVALGFRSLSATDDDNTGSDSSIWSGNAQMASPYPGMAFGIYNEFGSAISWNDEPISEVFVYNNTEFQLYKNKTIYANDSGGTSGWGWSVGNGDDTFTYSYANFNQLNKWNGKDMGIMAWMSAIQNADASVWWQAFESESGRRYMVNNTDRVDAYNTSSKTMSDLLSNVAYVLDTELGKVISSYGDSAFFDAAGKVVSAEDTDNDGAAEVVVFENGTLTADGFQQYVIDFEVLGTQPVLENDAYDLTWNVNLLDGYDDAFQTFNDTYSVVDFGVVVTATNSAEDVQNVEDLVADPTKTAVAGRAYQTSYGTTVYSHFNYRRTGVKAGCTRYVTFYLIYQDGEGNQYSVLSTTDGIVAE